MFLAPAQVTDLSSGARVFTRTSELSLGGCCIHSVKPFAAGALVGLRLFRDRRMLEATGKVIYFHAGKGMGVAFTELAPDQRSMLEGWLAKLA